MTRHALRNALSLMLLAAAMPAAHGQFLSNVGSAARETTLGASDWRASAALSSSLRFDSPAWSSSLDGAVESRFGAAAVSSGAFSTVLALPAFGGLRLVGSTSVDRDRSMASSPDDRAADLSLSYRRGAGGAWLGYGASRFSTPSILAGAWRQLGRISLSVGSTVRQGAVGARSTSVSTTWIPADSVFKQDSGWSHPLRLDTTGVTESAARRLMWAETEAHVGWAASRVALDGIVGWRSRLDSIHENVSLKAYAAIQLSSKTWLSLGGGTVTSRLPFVRSQGRFLSVALKVSPAAFIRPKSPAPITPSAAAFSVHRVDREYVVTIRVPKARVVELAGDFNGWHPVRLTEVRADEWEVVLPVGPGTYRMNLRVDGERWVAPPGTPQVDDEFNGKVGLVVIR